VVEVGRLKTSSCGTCQLRRDFPNLRQLIARVTSVHLETNHLNLIHSTRPIHHTSSLIQLSLQFSRADIEHISNPPLHATHHSRCSETNMTTMQLHCMLFKDSPPIVFTTDDTVQLATRSHLPGRIRTRSRQARFSCRRYRQQDPCRACRNKGTLPLSPSIHHITDLLPPQPLFPNP